MHSQLGGNLRVSPVNAIDTLYMSGSVGANGSNDTETPTTQQYHRS
jgi:hypothetical protein